MNLMSSTIFDVTKFSHCLWVVDDGLQKKTPTVPPDYRLCTQIGFYVPQLVKALRKLFSKPSFTDSFEGMTLHSLFHSSICQFGGLAIRSQGLSLSLHQKMLVDIGVHCMMEKVWMLPRWIAQRTRMMRYATSRITYLITSICSI